MTNNLSSKCYKDLMMEHKSIVIPPAPGVEKTNLPSSVEDGKNENQAEDSSHKQPASRCFQCQKRLVLTGFHCRCGGTFCSSHRHSEAHECSFDYKSAGRKAIARENPAVKADKIEKM